MRGVRVSGRWRAVVMTLMSSRVKYAFEEYGGTLSSLGL